MKRLRADEVAAKRHDDWPFCRTLQEVKPAQEWAFFRMLWPYEQMRWLYAMHGMTMCGLDNTDVVRFVLTLFMHCSCLERQCNREIAPLTERAYERLPPGILLFDAMRDLLLAYHRGKVGKERASVIPERMNLISANDSPRDGLGACMDYTDERFQEAMDEQYDTTWIVLPPTRVYACVDGLDTETIRQYIKKGSWSDKSLLKWQATLPPVSASLPLVAHDPRQLLNRKKMRYTQTTLSDFPRL